MFEIVVNILAIAFFIAMAITTFHSNKKLKVAIATGQPSVPHVMRFINPVLTVTFSLMAIVNIIRLAIEVMQ